MLAFCACNNDEKPDNVGVDSNYAAIVFTDQDEEGGGYTLGTWKPSSSIGYIATDKTEYKLTDLIGDSVGYKNYGSCCFNWKTSSYKVTRIEFDAVSLEDFTIDLYLYNPTRTEFHTEVSFVAGQPQHVVIDCSLRKNTKYFSIEGKTANYSAEWKLSNFKVTAEKV